MNARFIVVGFASLAVACLGLGCRQILDIDEDRPLIGGAGGAAASGSGSATGMTNGSTTDPSATTTTTTDGSASTQDAATGSTSAGGDPSEWPAWPLTPEDAPTANYALTVDTATDMTTGLTWPRKLGDLSGTFAEAVAYCDTLDLGDFTDWRLPTRIELQTLLSYSGDLVTINDDVFEGELSSSYWATSRYLRMGAVDTRWIVSFSSFTGTSHQPENESAHVTCVRRAPASAAPFLPGDGIVAAPDTGLTWQATPAPSAQTWSAATTYCADLDLEGIGWRLPTALELLSIIDSEGSGPELLDPLFASGTKTKYWSTTRDMGLPNHVTVDVRFGSPGSHSDNSPDTAIARCVR